MSNKKFNVERQWMLNFRLFFISVGIGEVLLLPLRQREVVLELSVPVLCLPAPLALVALVKVIRTLWKKAKRRSSGAGSAAPAAACCPGPVLPGAWPGTPPWPRALENDALLREKRGAAASPQPAPAAATSSRLLSEPPDAALCFAPHVRWLQASSSAQGATRYFTVVRHLAR